MDVEVALIAPEAKLAAEFQAHIADVALALEGVVPARFETVRVQGTERFTGNEGAGRVEVEPAPGAVVHPAVRRHALVAEIAAQVLRRVWRLLEQLEGITMETGHNFLAKLCAGGMQVEVALLAAVAPLAIRQWIPAPVAPLPGARVVVRGHERQRVRVRETPQQWL